jgi:DNA-binding CsgD family transcriptional regulator
LALRACGAQSVCLGLIEHDLWQPWLRAGRAGMLDQAEIPTRAPIELAALGPVERRVLASGSTEAHDLSDTDGGRLVVCAVLGGGHVLGLLHLCGDEGLDADLAEEFADGLGTVLDLVGTLERVDEQRYLLGHIAQRLSGIDGPAVELWSGTSGTGPEPVFPGATAKIRAPERSDGIRGALTARQREVLDLILAGLSNAEIAEQLVISVTTVKSHVRAILRASGAVSRADAMARLARDPAAPRRATVTGTGHVARS